MKAVDARDEKQVPDWFTGLSQYDQDGLTAVGLASILVAHINEAVSVPRAKRLKVPGLVGLPLAFTNDILQALISGEVGSFFESIETFCEDIPVLVKNGVVKHYPLRANGDWLSKEEFAGHQPWKGFKRICAAPSQLTQTRLGDAFEVFADEINCIFGTLKTTAAKSYSGRQVSLSKSDEELGLCTEEKRPRIEDLVFLKTSTDYNEKAKLVTSLLTHSFISVHGSSAKVEKKQRDWILERQKQIIRDALDYATPTNDTPQAEESIVTCLSNQLYAAILDDNREVHPEKTSQAIAEERKDVLSKLARKDVAECNADDKIGFRNLVLSILQDLKADSRVLMSLSYPSAIALLVQEKLGKPKPKARKSFFAFPMYEEPTIISGGSGVTYLFVLEQIARRLSSFIVKPKLQPRTGLEADIGTDVVRQAAATTPDGEFLAELKLEYGRAVMNAGMKCSTSSDDPRLRELLEETLKETAERMGITFAEGMGIFNGSNLFRANAKDAEQQHRSNNE